MSLRLKVLLLLALLCLGSGYWAYRWVQGNIRPQLLRIMEDDMVDQAYLLTRLVENKLPAKGHQKAIARLSIGRIMKEVAQARIKARIYEWEKRRFDFRIYITDARGIVRLDTDNNRDVGRDYSRWNDVYRAVRGRYGARSSTETDSQGRLIKSLYVAFPFYKGGKLAGVLTLSKNKASLTGWAQRAQKKLWQGVLLGTTVVFVLALLLTQLALQPIFRLTQYARDVAAGRRVDPPAVGGDELGELTGAFIEMKTALWQRRDLEQYVTQLTHEMKSPLSAIQGAAELLEDPAMPSADRLHFLQNIQQQTQRMTDIIQRLLLLVSLEQREELQAPAWIEVAPLLEEMCERFLPLAQQKEITLQAHLEEGAPSRFCGERFLMEQALANLLQNSLHFTPPKGTIAIFARQPEPGFLEFSVTDSGPGIPHYALQRVTERFYSLEHPDTGHKGTGLGLPFVQQVALLHGGDFSIQNGESQGAIARIWLPLS